MLRDAYTTTAGVCAATSARPTLVISVNPNGIRQRRRLTVGGGATDSWQSPAVPNTERGLLAKLPMTDRQGMTTSRHRYSGVPSCSVRVNYSHDTRGA